MQSKRKVANQQAQFHLVMRKLHALLLVLIVLGSTQSPAAGTGSLDQVSGWYPLGTNLTVHALPGINSVFTCWQGNTNGAVLVGTQITLVVNSSLSVTGVFSAILPTNQLVKIQDLAISGKVLSLNVHHGVPYSQWVLLQSANLLLPIGQWQTNRTGLYDGSGNLFTNLQNTATNSIGFFILK